MSLLFLNEQKTIPGLNYFPSKFRWIFQVDERKATKYTEVTTLIYITVFLHDLYP